MTGWNESAWFSLLMGAALKSTLVLGAAWLMAMALRGRSAAALHLVWTAGSAALLTLPLLSVAIPAVRVTVPGALLPPGVMFQTTAVAGAAGAVSPAVARPGAAANAPVKPAPWHPDWRLWLMLLWAAGCSLASAQMLAGWAAMRRVRRAAKPFRDPSLPALLKALGMDGEVDVLETRAGRMPVSFGLFRPAVLMPADAADWSAERRRVVLLHELAHVRRGDHATHLLARAALSLYWWNPLAWMAWREFLKARERAADDIVLSLGAAAPDYASHLLEIARTMQASPAIGWAAVAMARPSQLEGRLLAILDSRRSRKSPGRASAWVAALVAAAIAVPLAALQAQNTPPAPPADLDATIRAAAAQKNHEMLETAAKDAEAAREYDTARTLLDSSLAIREQASGQHSASYGLGLLKIGDLERTRGNIADAETFYQKALSVLDGTPEAATALIDLGTLALANRDGAKPDYDLAFGYFERAQAADSTKAGAALMWMAIARDRQGRAADAESLLRSALAVEDPNSAQAATIMELYALFLRRNNRADDAKPIQEQADALRKAQGQHAPVIVVNPPPVEVSTSEAVRVGNGVTAPQLTHKIEPEYTEEARAAKYQGTVVLYVEIGPDGKARNMRVLRGLGLGLDQKAIDAVGKWQFQPGMRNGVPARVQATVEVNFRLL
jgi:TonB family protein